MRVVLMIEGQESVTWEQWVALADACEQHGFDGLFTSDHYASVQRMPGRGAFDAWTVLGALAARTRRIRLGTLVSPVTFRHPSVVAKAAVTVDHVSGGRAELGLGAGWFEDEHRMHGIPFPETGTRLAMLGEHLEVIHRSWGEEPFSFDGAHVRVEEGNPLPKPVQRPHLPLNVGGLGGPRSARFAARWADEYNLVSTRRDEVPARRGTLLGACLGVDRDPADLRLSFMAGLVVGQDPEQVLARAAQVAERTGWGDGAGSLLDRVAGRWFVGTPKEVVGQIEELRAAGVERVMLQHLLHDDLEAVGLVAREVLPSVL